MPTPEKPASSRSSADEGPSQGGVLDSLLGEVRRRVPAELPRSLEQGVRLGQKALTGNLAWLQAQIDRRASQADVDRLTRRVDEVARQVQELVAQRAAGASRAERSPSAPAKASSTGGTARRATPSRRRRPAAHDEQTGARQPEVPERNGGRKGKKG